jgi:hypothetical protein
VKHPAARSPSFSVRGLIDLVHPVLASKLQLSVLVPLDGSLDRTQVLHPGLDFCRHTFWPPRLQFYVSEVSVGLDSCKSQSSSLVRVYESLQGGGGITLESPD